MAKITLSVPDDLYEKMDKYKDVINFSELFREAASRKLETLEGRSEIIEALHEYLRIRSPNKEAVRNIELDRFSKKWGEPDVQIPDDSPGAEPPYIILEKKIEVKPENVALVTLRVMNRVQVKPEELTEFRPDVWKRYVYGRVEQIVESLKAQGFKVGERYLLQPQVIQFVADGRRHDGIELSRLYEYYGLFAINDRDAIFITCRQAKRGD